MNRRALLRGAGAAAALIPLAPIIALGIPPTQVLPNTAWKLGYATHWLPITDELLADSAPMRAYISSRLQGLMDEEHVRAMLYGNGEPLRVLGRL